MKILVCGDSYCVPDPKNFPNLNWVEKISNHSSEYEVYNMAYGGCSNAMIAYQILLGLSTNPDFVICSFTTDLRCEIDNDVESTPLDLSWKSLSKHLKQRFITNMYREKIDQEKIAVIDRWLAVARSDTFEKLKNYFMISFCLQTLEQKKIPFAFSLGGFEFQQDCNKLIESTYVYDFFKDYIQHKIKINLWYFGRKSIPWFHVDDDNAQSLFARECIIRIESSREKNC